MKSTILLRNRTTKQVTPIEVTSYITDKPGLIVHRSVYLGYDDKIHRENKSWKITHAKSGMSACPHWHPIETRKEAIEIANQYPNVDWTENIETVYAALKKSTRKVLEVFRDREEK